MSSESQLRKEIGALKESLGDLAEAVTILAEQAGSDAAMKRVTIAKVKLP